MQKIKEAKQEHEIARIREELNGYEYEDTIERIETGGYVAGLSAGMLDGFQYAIELLNREGFTEHANILQNQANDLENEIEEAQKSWDLDGVSLEVLQPSGGFLIAGIQNGYRIARTYFCDYRGEAVELFIEEVKELNK